MPGSGKNFYNEDGKKVMHWDDSGDRQLFLAVLVNHDVKVDFEKVAGYLGCSVRAVQERLKTLRKVALKEADVGAKPAAARNAVKNPKPAIAAKAVQKRRGPKAKAQSGVESALPGDDDEEDGEDENSSQKGDDEATPRPVKKRKAAA